MLLHDSSPLANILKRFFSIRLSASTSNIARIEEMERLLKQAHAEKTRLLESRGRQSCCQERVMGMGRGALHLPAAFLQGHD